MLYGTPDRESAWRQLSDEGWEVIVVGGGITGAGILREAARVGLRVLLLEQNDFASGTSSRSSKLVHGGLRYLNNLQFGVTWQAVRERETLLRDGPGLIDPLPFMFVTYRRDRLPPWLMRVGLTIYSWMAGHWRAYQSFDPFDVGMMFPGLSQSRLTGGLRYRDALTDDARLVLRVIREGVAGGTALALNYALVEGLLHDADGQVNGVRVRDRETGRVAEARAAAVVNATGVWADHLRGALGAPPRIRPLRGSHLIFPRHRFPLFQAMTSPHPDDGRTVFMFPWEGVTVVGTTDLDHAESLDREPAISPEEVRYLLRLAQVRFPGLGLSERDVMGTFAGVRAVISSRHDAAPSKESRKHVLWNESGLLTVTGGKLTTFRHIALDALRALRGRLLRLHHLDDRASALDPPPSFDEPPPGLTRHEASRLVARYGAGILAFAAARPDAERRRINDLPVHPLELAWAARHEAVRHLDDLLLRRVRLGLLMPNGGEGRLPQIRSLVQPELGWSDTRWEQEEADYLMRWRSTYGTPETLR